MSASIIELSGQHIGTLVTVVDSASGVTASGVLFSVQHEAELVSSPRFAAQAPVYSVGRRATHVDLGGVGTLTLSARATFISEDAERTT
ncbi:hypothetical protein SEA_GLOBIWARMING_73 [Arthrobacter phage GlobiWarming]|nr:hypothetical protein SEA_GLOBIWARMING_73 [Arthrobacter phage GlobiWarming]